jgi:hypothetical protein
MVSRGSTVLTTTVRRREVPQMGLNACMAMLQRNRAPVVSSKGVSLRTGFMSGGANQIHACTVSTHAWSTQYIEAQGDVEHCLHAWAATHRQWSVSLTDSTHMHPRIHPTSHRMSLISFGVVCQSSSSGCIPSFKFQGIQSIDLTRQVYRYVVQL